MGKKGKKAQAGKLTKKAVFKRLDALAKNLEEELKDADLFAPLPPTEDCPICCVPLSRIARKIMNRPCCGKDICAGCAKENEEFIEMQNAKNAGKKDKKLLALTCPFCREPKQTPEEQYRRTEARAAKNDHHALSQLGMTLIEGEDGAPKDELRGLDCWIRAAELGSAEACNNIGVLYYSKGEYNVLPSNNERFVLFAKAGALRGHIVARHAIGSFEYFDLHNHELGIRHWKVAAEAGNQTSLDKLKAIFYTKGKLPGNEFITKDELDKIYRSCHAAQEEVKSEGREKYCQEYLQQELSDMKC